MKILVTGVNGQLGHDVMNELHRRGHEGIGSGRTPSYAGLADGSPVCAMPYFPMELADGEAVARTLREIAPEAVIHCAAWTAVDAAEDEENFSAVRAANADAPGVIARTCRELGASMVYISTDYVFDGRGTEPWRPDDENFGPLCVYGQSKLDGEFAVREALERYFIVRTAWVFGASGKNFIRTMLNVGRTHDTVRVVNDQIGRPTYTYDLARLLVDMAETERYGIYHATNEGEFISWYDFTKAIYREAGMDTKVIPVTTAEYGLSKAARPFNSRLDTGKLAEAGFVPLPPWQDALRRYLQEIKE